MRKLSLFLISSFILLPLSSCGPKEEVFVSGTPKTEYKINEFFTLEGLNINSDNYKIYLNDKEFKEGQILKNREDNINVLIKDEDKEYRYNISVKDKDSLDISFNDFTYYDLNKNNDNNTLPLKGKASILVIPVTIKGYENNANEDNLNKINKVFTSKNDEDLAYFSLKEYYELSSFNNIELDIKVAPSWFDLGLTPIDIYMESVNKDYGMGYVLNKSIEWYKNTYEEDLTKYDNDKDGFIDGVWLVYSAPYFNGSNFSSKVSDLMWAFSYWDFNNKYNANILDPVPYLFSWASVDFINLGYSNKLDSHMYIHETGHQFGLLDLYSTRYDSYPYGCVDMMDFNVGDICAFEKYSLGWNEPIVVEEPKEYILNPYENEGEFLVFGGKTFQNGAFDEYFTFEYITPTGLNELDYTSIYKGIDDIQGYENPGIKITHVDNRAKGNNQVSYDPNEMKTNYANNGGTTNVRVNNNYIRQATLINKDYEKGTSTDPISISFNKTDEALFYDGEQFEFNESSKYISLMPSNSTKLNKYYIDFDDDAILDFKVSITFEDNTAKLLFEF